MISHEKFILEVFKGTVYFNHEIKKNNPLLYKKTLMIRDGYLESSRIRKRNVH
jgi:hypothetical protein